MTKVLVGMVTFGNLKYTRMSLNALRDHTSLPFDLMVVSGKKNDGTEKFCKSEGIDCKLHSVNWGFPRGINDIYERAWVQNDYDYVVVIGNDVLPYQGAIDSLVELADRSDYEWIAGVEHMTPSQLVKKFPKYSNNFTGGRYNLKGDVFTGWKEIMVPKSDKLTDLKNHAIVGDSHNLCLFKKSLFDKIGYVDVNFYPAYFEDNDYGRRARLTEAKMARYSGSPYFHFWSRTIHEAGMSATNDKYFPLNEKHYIRKWGGKPGKETWNIPFNGKNFDGYSSEIKISDRDLEERIINKWRAK